jgi:hypothetical protein
MSSSRKIQRHVVNSSGMPLPTLSQDNDEPSLPVDP